MCSLSYVSQDYAEENGDLELLMSGGGGADLDEGEVGGDEEEEGGGGGGGGGHLKGRKEGGGGDELDLALSALRDCDTDFSKFLPVRKSRSGLKTRICTVT
jgi:hypothetical protein